jgi:hypothetical protein
MALLTRTLNDRQDVLGEGGSAARGRWRGNLSSRNRRRCEQEAGCYRQPHATGSRRNPRHTPPLYGYPGRLKAMGRRCVLQFAESEHTLHP